MFHKILVANRGEIALRVIRACRDLGIEVAVVYSEADRGAPYLELADQAICIGPPVSAESYLKIPRIIAAAEVVGAQAIHPGYGFLSENSKFAEQCRESGIEFIGPPVEAMDKLGNKDKAKAVAKAAKVPTVPGSEGLIKSDDEAIKFAQLGRLSRAHQGVGRRRRPRHARRPRRGRAPAQPPPGQGRSRGRVQGRQRLHREVPRSPAPRRSPTARRSARQRHPPLRARLLAPAPPPEARRGIAFSEPARQGARRKCARPRCGWRRQAGYFSAGTCEFLVDQKNNYYFIEVNARIQVEHPVTELVTGVDLIREQIRVAAGEKLRYTQKDIVQRGARHRGPHQRRGYGQRLPPSPGTVTTWRPPGGPGVRLDSHVVTGYRVPPNYDSMVAKLLVYQPTRAEAFAVMRRALREFKVEGIHTTIPILKRIFDTPEFIEGKIDTTFIERVLMPPKKT